MTDDNVQFFSSGSTLLDLALGGGWAVPRIFNIVGDKSTGKTLQAIEAFANFKLTFPKGRMRYAEAEAAFDDAYAEVLGFPDDVEKPDEPIKSTSLFEKDFYNFMTASKDPGLYILDSLDALSSDVQIENFQKRVKDEKEKGSFGAEKAKDLSEMFRHIATDMMKHNVCLGIISQIRDNIGVTWGETKTRSGGHALDFYASQVLWLAQIEKIERTALNIKRPVGVKVEGYVKKNKVGTPFRKAQWPLIFFYGVDDEISMLDWLKVNKQMTAEAYKTIKDQVETAREKQDFSALYSVKKMLQEDVTRVWNEVEARLSPPIRKYGNPIVSVPTSDLRSLATEAKKAIDSTVDTIEERKITIRNGAWKDRLLKEREEKGDKISPN